jgi:hypothetical protein
MPRIMQPARVPAGQVPSVIGLTTVANPNALLIRGALVVSTAGLIDVCGADPALIAGVALQDASSAPGYSAANNPTVVTGRTNKVSTAIANGVTEFSATFTNGSAVLIAPTQADVGVQYGVTAYAGVWTVDKAKTAASARVVITGIDTDSNVVFFRILKANRQLDA